MYLWYTNRFVCHTYHLHQYEYKDQNEYETLCAPDRAKVNEIIAEYRALPQTATDEEKDAVLAKYDEVNEHIAKVTKDFVIRKPSSLFSATLVNHLVGDDGKDALDVLARIPDDVKQGMMKFYIDQATSRANQAKARTEAAEKVKDGMQAPDFTLKNEKGEDFALSSIYNKGKYIIVDLNKLDFVERDEDLGLVYNMIDAEINSLFS